MRPDLSNKNHVTVVKCQFEKIAPKQLHRRNSDQHVLNKTLTNMATSPWNKTLKVFQKNKLAPPNARESSMPAHNAPVSLKLLGADMVFENGVWKAGEKYLNECL